MSVRLAVLHCACKRLGAVVIFGAIASCAVPNATAAGDAEMATALFEKMAKATRTLNYDGVFVYRRGTQTDSMRIIHRAGQDGEQERLISLSGPAREVIRDNQTVTCIFPEAKSVMVERSKPRKLFPVINQPAFEIAKHYQFVLLGKDRIANRPAWMIGILPRSAYRYGYRFWIDAENHLLLRSEVVNSRGVALEQILFTQVGVVSQIPDQLLKPAINGKEYIWYDNSTGPIKAASAQSGKKVENWKVQWLPEGFSMREYQILQLSASAEPVEHIVYSDGLAMISVFVEKLGESTDPLKGFSLMGAVTAYSVTSDQYQITVVGEVPPLTVRQVAASVVSSASP